MMVRSAEKIFLLFFENGKIDPPGDLLCVMGEGEYLSA